jgi:predicted nucleic acid-binding protein
VSYLLDTNAVSEWVKPRPDPGLAAWLAGVDEDRVFISVVTFAELRRGVERMPSGARRRRLDAWLTHALPDRFEGRILSIDSIVADAWGRLVADREAAGRPIGVMGAFIAAIANVYQLGLVTRNSADLETTVAEVLNPWTGAAT